MDYREGPAPIRGRFSRQRRGNGERSVHKLRNGPSAIGNANGLRWRRAQSFMNPAEIVVGATYSATTATWLSSFFEKPLVNRVNRRWPMALIVANEFLENEVCELMQAVSHAYVRGRFKTYTG